MPSGRQADVPHTEARVHQPARRRGSGMAGGGAGAPLVATMPAKIAHFFAETLGLSISPAPVELPEAVASLVWHASYDQDPANFWLRQTVESIAAKAGWRRK